MGIQKKSARAESNREIHEKKKKRLKREEKYVKFAAKLSVRTELDVDTLVEAKPYEIQRLLHSALFF